MIRGVEEEPEGSKPGEEDTAEILLCLRWWQGKRVMEDESVERERGGQSTEDGGEEKDTVEGGEDEIGGG